MDPEVLITHYLPELADTSWSGCSLRHLLDMRSGVRFSEDYTDPDCDIFVTDAIIGWGPPDSSRDDFWAYIAQLPADEPHGTRFGYRSIQTDLLGWIVERVTGLSYAQAMSTFIWSGIGAEYDADMTVNPRGQSLPAGESPRRPMTSFDSASTFVSAARSRPDRSSTTRSAAMRSAGGRGSKARSPGWPPMGTIATSGGYGIQPKVSCLPSAPTAS